MKNYKGKILKESWGSRAHEKNKKNEHQTRNNKVDDRELFLLFWWFLMFILASREMSRKIRPEKIAAAKADVEMRLKRFPPREQSEAFNLKYRRREFRLKFLSFCATKQQLEERRKDRNRRKNWPSRRINANGAGTKNAKSWNNIEIGGLPSSSKKCAQSEKDLFQIPFILLYAFNFVFHGNLLYFASPLARDKTFACRSILVFFTQQCWTIISRKKAFMSSAEGGDFVPLLRLSSSWRLRQ